MKRIINKIRNLFCLKRNIVFGGKTITEILKMNLENKEKK